jgi:hypothetical protein
MEKDKMYNAKNPGTNSPESVKMMNERQDPAKKQRAKNIMSKAVARSKKSKMMEMGADYYIKKDREELGY